MTTLGFPETWRFKGVDLSSYAVLVQKVDGVDDLPPLRGQNTLIPSILGRRHAGKRFDEKRLTLALFVNSLNTAGTVTEPTNTRQARANLDALYAVFGDHTPGALVRVMPDASERTAIAEVVSVGDIDNDYGGEALGIVVDFLLADPHFYGAAITETQAISGSPTNFSITHPGTVATHRPVLTFTGPISNPRLANLTLDSGGLFYVEALVTVGSGKLLVIDCDHWTALNDGVNAIGSVRHSGAFEFFRLVPGVNSLRVASTSPGGSLSLVYAPPYL